jgi:hypothetical protein
LLPVVVVVVVVVHLFRASPRGATAARDGTTRDASDALATRDRRVAAEATLASARARRRSAALISLSSTPRASTVRSSGLVDATKTDDESRSSSPTGRGRARAPSQSATRALQVVQVATTRRARLARAA